MQITQLNHYRGETITFTWTGDETYVFANDGEHPFKMLIYPEGMDMTDPSNMVNLRQIDSRDVKTGNSDPTPTYGDGFVYYVTEQENTVFCVLPWEKTQDMVTGAYTVELLYGMDTRAVITKNNAFTLVSSVSEHVDENYDKIETGNE